MKLITTFLTTLSLSFFVNAQHLYQEITEIQMPTIHQTFTSDSIVEQYGKFELALDLTATYENPYDYNEVQVKALFTSPNDTERNVDGFFMQDYDLNTTSGGITPIGNGVFKVRFSPHQIGEWIYEISVTDANGTSQITTGTFECVEIESPNNNGFVRTGQTNYLEFDNGEQLILVGENMAWQNSNPYTNYKNWLTQLNDNGGNYFRLWHAHWGLGIEWKEGWNGFHGLGQYKESNCFYQDWLYDFCAEKGIYIMLTLQHHGPVSSNVNSNWKDSPYNIVNGGMCQNTWDFFTHPDAIALTQNRYRYIVARWGYSRSILTWELFNEVNWTDNFSTHQTEIQDWHADMAAFLKGIDPYQHLVTTSYAHSDQDPVVWNNPDIDITQTHFYINTSNIERALAAGVQEYLELYEKPTLTGEFGLGGSPNLSNADPDGIHLHNALWGALFGGGIGTAMTWWWDVYVHPRDLYYHFGPVASMTADVPFVDKDMQPTTAYVIDAPGDLILTPNLGWGSLGDEDITINENGTTTPSNPGLGQYLYGSSWNTQYRSPPNFSVNFPEEGEFTVKTNMDSGQNPKISIYLNGNLVLNENADTNETFTILVPPGPNLIKVDNLGTDWITIGSYEFMGVGSKADVYALVSDDQQVATGWVLNRDYNHISIDENGEPESIIGGELVIEGFQDGDYFVKWYDCLTGAIVDAGSAASINGELFLPIPELYWDLAFRVDEEEVDVSSTSVIQSLSFKLYPNPIEVGGMVTLEMEEGLEIEQVNLLEVSGRLIADLEFSKSAKWQFILPQNLANGFYWIKVEGEEGKVGTRPFVIVKEN